MENKQIDKEPISQIEADEVASLDNNELSKEEQLQAQIEELEEKKASLLQKIEEAIAEQNQLSKELDNVVGETIKITANASDVRDKITTDMDGTGKAMKEINDYTESLFHILDELTVSYFSLKNISAASKSLTEYTQMYNTKYHFYNELRRIALGYVIGLDNHIIHNENLRMKVEKTVLQNSEYWLSYALSAVMLWANNEEEAANRAIVKALNLDHNRACLYFLLINLRFSRIDAARMWFLKYLDRFDISEVGEEWQYLLEAYLYNCFGKSQSFLSQVSKEIDEIINKVKIINVGYERKVTNQFTEYITVYPHSTKEEFINLSRYCTNYQDMLNLLTLAEKNFCLANYFTEIYAISEDDVTDLARKIENTLYDLINSYDDNEYEVYKKIKYYEAIIQAKGDITVATKNYELLYENNHKFGLDELLLRWAIADKDVNLNIRLRHFAMNYLNDCLVQGALNFQKNYQSQLKDEYEFVIDEYHIPYQYGHDEEAFKNLNKHYSKSFFWYAFDNRLIIISLMLTLCGITTLSLLPFYYDIIALIIGIAVTVIFGGLSIFGILRRKRTFNKRKEKYIKQLEDTIKDFDRWYDAYKDADKKAMVLKATIERFKSEGESTK